MPAERIRCALLLALVALGAGDRLRGQATHAPVVVATAPDSDAIIEDLAWDGARERFIVSDVRHHRLRTVDLRGRWGNFGAPLPSGWAPLGVAIDSARGVLWVGSATLPQAEGFRAEDSSRAAILRFGLADGRLQHHYDVPGRTRAAPGDLAVAANHDVFSGDGMIGTVYAIRASRDSLETMVPAGTFHSTQQPAILPDQRHLVIPDYRNGLAVVDLASGSFAWLTTASGGRLRGIDGLVLDGHDLIAVHNATDPQEILRVTLDSAFATIADAAVLLHDTVLADEPTHVALVNGKLYAIGNAGWNKYDDEGRPRADVPPRAPKILTIP